MGLGREGEITHSPVLPLCPPPPLHCCSGGRATHKGGGQSSTLGSGKASSAVMCSQLGAPCGSGIQRMGKVGVLTHPVPSLTSWAAANCHPIEWELAVTLQPCLGPNFRLVQPRRIRSLREREWEAEVTLVQVRSASSHASLIR